VFFGFTSIKLWIQTAAESHAASASPQWYFPQLKRSLFVERIEVNPLSIPRPIGRSVVGPGDQRSAPAVPYIDVNCAQLDPFRRDCVVQPHQHREQQHVDAERQRHGHDRDGNRHDHRDLRQFDEHDHAFFDGNSRSSGQQSSLTLGRCGYRRHGCGRKRQLCQRHLHGLRSQSSLGLPLTVTGGRSGRVGIKQFFCNKIQNVRQTDIPFAPAT
jgi:hypothetical protein